jgi:hypothetical protein
MLRIDDKKPNISVIASVAIRHTQSSLAMTDKKQKSAHPVQRERRKRGEA